MLLVEMCPYATQTIGIKLEKERGNNGNGLNYNFKNDNLE